MLAPFHNVLLVLALATSVLFVATGCVVASAPLSGAAYLNTLQSARRLDSKAEKVCTKAAGTPALKLLVAANSTLNSVRNLERPGFAAQEKDPNLTGNEQGYAAICRFKKPNSAKAVAIWVYELPDGYGDFIDAAPN